MEVDRGEALQERDGDRGGRHHARDRLTEDAFEAARGRLGTALVERLGRDGDAERGRSLSEFLKRCLGISEKPEDQGLGEGGAAERRGALDELRRPRGLVGRGCQNLLHRGRDVCYSRHREAPAEYHGVRQQHDATGASFRSALA